MGSVYSWSVPSRVSPSMILVTVTVFPTSANAKIATYTWSFFAPRYCIFPYTVGPENLCGAKRRTSSLSLLRAICVCWLLNTRFSCGNKVNPSREKGVLPPSLSSRNQPHTSAGTFIIFCTSIHSSWYWLPLGFGKNLVIIIPEKTDGVHAVLPPLFCTVSLALDEDPFSPCTITSSVRMSTLPHWSVMVRTISYWPILWNVCEWGLQLVLLYPSP